MRRYIATFLDKEVTVYKVSDEFLHRCAAGVAPVTDEAFLKYLEQTRPAQILLDTTRCIVCGASISSFETICASQPWLWSADLNHYTRCHDFNWPTAFLTAARKDDYQPKRLMWPHSELPEHVLYSIYKQVFNEHALLSDRHQPSPLKIPDWTFNIIEL